MGANARRFDLGVRERVHTLAGFARKFRPALQGLGLWTLSLIRKATADMGGTVPRAIRRTSGLRLANVDRGFFAGAARGCVRA